MIVAYMHVYAPRAGTRVYRGTMKAGASASAACGTGSKPVHQRRTIEMDALTGQHLGLTVERQMPRELRDGDMRQQRGVGRPPSIGRGGAGASRPRLHRCGSRISAADAPACGSWPTPVSRARPGNPCPFGYAVRRITER